MRKKRWLLKGLIGLLLYLCFGALSVEGVVVDEPSFLERLRDLPGVTEVERLPVEEGSFYSEKYLVTFRQPLDWEDLEGESFPQRVEVGIRPLNVTNIMEVEGYYLDPQRYSGEDEPELCRYLEGNYIHIEHRFFGKSLPEGLSSDKASYWSFLTPENAARDFHRIYSELSTVLPGTWVGMGVSRGGLVCETYAFLYPEDLAGFVSYVAPCSRGMGDGRMYPFVYTAIGKGRLGPIQAARCRALVLAVQVELMRQKEVFLPRMVEALKEQGTLFQEGAAMEKVYDMAVLEFAIKEWQYYQDFEGLGHILAMVRTPEEAGEDTGRDLTEWSQGQEALFSLLMEVGEPGDWSRTVGMWPYYVNTCLAYGQYHYDFSTLRKVLEAAGLEDALSVGEAEEEDFLESLVFTKEQRSELRDGSEAFFREFSRLAEKTTCRGILLVGGSDPWRSLRLHTENPHLHTYIHPWEAHGAKISNLPEKTQEEVLEEILSWLGM